MDAKSAFTAVSPAGNLGTWLPAVPSTQPQLPGRSLRICARLTGRSSKWRCELERPISLSCISQSYFHPIYSVNPLSIPARLFLPGSLIISSFGQQQRRGHRLTPSVIFSELAFVFNYLAAQRNPAGLRELFSLDGRFVRLRLCLFSGVLSGTLTDKICLTRFSKDMHIFVYTHDHVCMCICVVSDNTSGHGKT